MALGWEAWWDREAPQLCWSLREVGVTVPWRQNVPLCPHLCHQGAAEPHTDTDTPCPQGKEAALLILRGCPHPVTALSTATAEVAGKSDGNGFGMIYTDTVTLITAVLRVWGLAENKPDFPAHPEGSEGLEAAGLNSWQEPVPLGRSGHIQWNFHKHKFTNSAVYCSSRLQPLVRLRVINALDPQKLRRTNVPRNSLMHLEAQIFTKGCPCFGEEGGASHLSGNEGYQEP